MEKIRPVVLVCAGLPSLIVGLVIIKYLVRDLLIKGRIIGSPRKK
jgi:hypothetical protein